MSILYINPLPKNMKFIVLNQDKEIIFEVDKPKNNDEFSFFPELLAETVKKYEVHEIWCVTGPGPFTLMRIVTLAINSIAYVESIILKSCNFFDLIEDGHIPIIEANAREYIIAPKKGEVMEYIEKGLLAPGTYEGLVSKIDFTDTISFVEYREDLESLSNIFTKRREESRIYPIYLKPPLITCSKKTTSHS